MDRSRSAASQLPSRDSSRRAALLARDSTFKQKRGQIRVRREGDMLVRW
jgi:hypothetical protein